MSSWFSSVLGGTLGGASSAAPAASGVVSSSEGSAAVDPAPERAQESGFAYWTTMAASVGTSFARESGFDMVDRVQAGDYTKMGDARKELAEIEANCKAIVTGVAEPPAIWRRWVSRMDESPPERFYDGLAHEDVNIKTLLLRSSALDVAISTILRKPSFASDADQSLLEFLDRILVGSRESKEDMLKELVKLAENVDGTASHDRIEALVISTLHQAKQDHRYEDALLETTDLLSHVDAKECELRALRMVSRGEKDAPSQGDDALDELVAGTEVGDDELRERVARSSELLDSNANLRHLVTVSGALLQERASRSSFAAVALEQVSCMRATVEEESASIKSRIQGVTGERKSVAQAQLEVVLGEIMSCDQQLKETRRELEVLPRQRESKDKNLAEQLQALAVQVQDSENEMDALEDTGAFIKKMGGLVEAALAQQERELVQTRRRVRADEERLIFVHLKHQVAQLLLLRDSLAFCTEELAQSETKTSKISKLGMPELVTEEETRVSMLHHKKQEAAARVLAIGQDVEDLRLQVDELGRNALQAGQEPAHTGLCAHEAAASSTAAGAQGQDKPAASSSLHSRIVSVLDQLSCDFESIKSTFQLAEADALVGAHGPSAQGAAPRFSPLPPRPPAAQELACVAPGEGCLAGRQEAQDELVAVEKDGKETQEGLEGLELVQ